MFIYLAPETLNLLHVLKFIALIRSINLNELSIEKLNKQELA